LSLTGVHRVSVGRQHIFPIYPDIFSMPFPGSAWSYALWSGYYKQYTFAQNAQRPPASSVPDSRAGCILTVY